MFLSILLSVSRCYAQFPHFGLECGSLHSQLDRGATRATHHPACLMENADDVFALRCF